MCVVFIFMAKIHKGTENTITYLTSAFILIKGLYITLSFSFFKVAKERKKDRKFL